MRTGAAKTERQKEARTTSETGPLCACARASAHASPQSEKVRSRVSSSSTRGKPAIWTVSSGAKQPARSPPRQRRILAATRRCSRGESVTERPRSQERYGRVQSARRCGCTRGRSLCDAARVSDAGERVGESVGELQVGELQVGARACCAWT